MALHQILHQYSKYLGLNLCKKKNQTWQIIMINMSCCRVVWMKAADLMYQLVQTHKERFADIDQ